MSAIVFGSLNMDLVSRVPRLPAPGETILGDRFDTTPGGKGANQAVALAKLGIPTQMVGRVGNDDFGKVLVEGDVISETLADGKRQVVVQSNNIRPIVEPKNPYNY